MKAKAIFFVSLTLLLTGCFVPVNLTYDSARMMDKGQIKVQGSYSRYNSKDTLDNFVNSNNNFGFAVAYGISDKNTLGMRYEHLDMTPAFGGIFENTDDDTEFENLLKMHYVEFNDRIQILEDIITFEPAMGVYWYSENNLAENPGDADFFGYLSIDPRFYFTFFGKTDIFELSIIPKAHIITSFLGGVYIMPGISLGMGFSSDLDRWAIRPEIGYDKFLSFGVGLNFNFNTIKQEK